MTMRDRLASRRADRAEAQPRAAAPAGGGAPAGAAAPVRPEIPGEAIISYACGCRVSVGRLRSDACPGCVSKRQAAKRGQQRLLPDGAAFGVTYDAARGLWRGSLTVGGSVFRGEARSVFGLLGRLDRFYRHSQRE